jgi:protocatechuate 3,4-dioxygenase beta subunit
MPHFQNGAESQEMNIKTYNPRDWRSHPPYSFKAYGSSVKRGPLKKLVPLKQTLSEITGPLFSDIKLEPGEDDLTRDANTGKEAMGERIIVVGKVMDEDERPVPNSVIEIWQANAAGRYHHPVDQHNAPLDPNFTGAGRCVTNDRGEYRYLTIKPGAYSPIVVRAKLRNATGDAIFLSRRSLDPARSDLQFGSDQKRSRALNGELCARCDRA